MQGTSVAVGGAGAGAAVGVAIATGGGWMYTYLGVSASDDGLDIPVSAVGAGEISDFRGWCYVTSRECTTIPVSVPMTLKQSLPLL